MTVPQTQDSDTSDQSRIADGTPDIHTENDPNLDSSIPPTQLLDVTDIRQQLFEAIEPAIFNHDDKLYLDRALDNLEALISQTVSSVIGPHLPGQQKINQHIDIQRITAKRLLGSTE